MEDELCATREANRKDLNEIDRLSHINEQKSSEAHERTGHLRQLEFEVSRTLNRLDELQRNVESKSKEL